MDLLSQDTIRQMEETNINAARPPSSLQDGQQSVLLVMLGTFVPILECLQFQTSNVILELTVLSLIQTLIDHNVAMDRLPLLEDHLIAWLVRMVYSQEIRVFAPHALQEIIAIS